MPIGELRFSTVLSLLQEEHRDLSHLAMVEGSRRMALGDMAGAWRWYRAVLRGSRLVGRHGSVITRLIGMAEYQAAQELATHWVRDPRADADDLRRALADVLALNALTPPDSEPIQIEYLMTMDAVNDTEKFVQDMMDSRQKIEAFDPSVWYHHFAWLRRAEWFAQHEPERSRRLIRLAFANWLAHCDTPPTKRPPWTGTQKNPKRLYLAPFTEPEARDISPIKLAPRIDAAPLADILLVSYDAVQGALDRDRALRSSLVLNLAEQLYEREQRKELTSYRALLDTGILDHLPEGFHASEPEEPAPAKP